MPNPLDEVLHRKLLSYDSQIVILGSRTGGREEVFTLVVDGVAVGEPCSTWPAAITRFREAVLEKKKATTA